jgi:hypothetical protein
VELLVSLPGAVNPFYKTVPTTAHKTTLCTLIASGAMFVRVQVTNTSTQEKGLGSKHARKDTLNSVWYDSTLVISAITGESLMVTVL